MGAAGPAAAEPDRAHVVQLGGGRLSGSGVRPLVAVVTSCSRAPRLPRITAELRGRVARAPSQSLMREHGLRTQDGSPRCRRHATRPGRGRWRAPDLIGRRFAAGWLNRRWYGDGTEIATGEGKLYLASVLDMGSRRIVGFALSEHHDAELAYAAMAMAIAVRGWPGGDRRRGAAHRPRARGIYRSVVPHRLPTLRHHPVHGPAGSALDNAVIESWHSTVEFELRRIERFATKAQARARVAIWIEEYNRDRRPPHWACAARSTTNAPCASTRRSCGCREPCHGL